MTRLIRTGSRGGADSVSIRERSSRSSITREMRMLGVNALSKTARNFGLGLLKERLGKQTECPHRGFHLMTDMANQVPPHFLKAATF